MEDCDEMDDFKQVKDLNKVKDGLSPSSLLSPDNGNVQTMQFTIEIETNLKGFDKVEDVTTNLVYLCFLWNGLVSSEKPISSFETRWRIFLDTEVSLAPTHVSLLVT